MIDWTSWMDYGFMKMAFAAILIITPLFGLMGTMIVNKKMAYFSDALGHSSLTGIAVGVVCGIPDTNISMVPYCGWWKSCRKKGAYAASIRSGYRCNCKKSMR